MEELVVIIPMNEFGDENVKLLNNAVNSVPNNVRVILSVPNKTNEHDLKDVINRIQLIQNTDGESFTELVNAAVEAIDEKWFSILEFDDTYTNIWMNNVKKYIEFMPETSVFMCLEDITDFNTSQYIGFGNSEAWASSFSNEIGYIDNDCLQNYFDFYLTGAIFNTSDWKEVGGLKPSIKVTFWYEWLLRATNKGKKVFVIPKVCYNHKLGRKNSLVEIYKETVNEEESQWLFELAKKEMFYKEDRNKTYDEYKKSIEEEK